MTLTRNLTVTVAAIIACVLAALAITVGAVASVVNCAASPHGCGYSDATNTGVSRAAQLLSVPGQVSSGPGWKYDTRGWVEVYGSGVTLSNLRITTNLDIKASNVTVSNVTVTTTGNSFGISLRHTSNVTIKNSNISSPYNTGPLRLQVAIKDIYGDTTGTTVTSNNIWNASSATQIGQGTIIGNYIHDLGYNTGDHVNGIKSEGGNSGGLTITHNTVFNPVGQTDAIGLFENFGPQRNALISDNLVAGGGYTVYGGANPGKWIPSNIVITNNRFSRIYSARGGSYGPVTALAAGVNGNTWTGNVWDDTGTPVTG